MRSTAAAFGRYRDVVLVLGVAAIGYVELFGHSTYQGSAVWQGPVWANAPLIALASVPLAWRRRRPLLCFLVVMSAVTTIAVVDHGGQATAAFVAGIAAVYSAALYANRPVVVAGVASLTALGVQLSTPANRNLDSMVWAISIMGLAWLLGRAVHGRQSTIDSLERQAEEQQRRHALAVEAATAAERASIARELHDIVSHTVSVIVIQAQVGIRALPAEPSIATDALATIEHGGRSALGELRRLLTLLSDEDIASVEPAPSLRNLAGLIDQCRRAGLAIEVVEHGDRPELAAAADLAAYRVVQEALTNTLRHAPGARTTLRLHGNTDGLRISIRDADGVTAQSSNLDLGTGRGLIGMRERVQLAGGSLGIADHVEGGFLVEAFLPAAERVPVVNVGRFDQQSAMA